MKYLTQTKTYALALLLLSAPVIKAQSGKDDKNFRFGLKIAPNISWINVDSKNISKGKSGVNFGYGLMGDIKFATNYAFSLGVDITSMTHSFTADTLNGIKDVDVKYKLRYLDIPIALKLKTREIGYITYYGSFGVTPGFLMKSRADYNPGVLGSLTPEDNEDVNTNEKENDFNAPNSSMTQDNVNFMRLPLSIGLGIEYSLSGNTSLMAGLRFDNGFTNIFADEDTKGQNKYLALNIGIFF